MNVVHSRLANLGDFGTFSKKIQFFPEAAWANFGDFLEDPGQSRAFFQKGAGDSGLNGQNFNFFQKTLQTFPFFGGF